MFTQTSIFVAESPDGCPRILFPDLAADFITLLNIVYLPEYVAWTHSNEPFR